MSEKERGWGGEKKSGMCGVRGLEGQRCGSFLVDVPKEEDESHTLQPGLQQRWTGWTNLNSIDCEQKYFSHKRLIRTFATWRDDGVVIHGTVILSPKATKQQPAPLGVQGTGA